eukprot:gene1333-11415_t
MEEEEELRLKDDKLISEQKEVVEEMKEEKDESSSSKCSTPERNSNYEINTTLKLKKKVSEMLEEAPVDLFDEMLKDLVQETIANIFRGFVICPMYQDMVNSTQKKWFKPMYLLVK